MNNVGNVENSFQNKVHFPVISTVDDAIDDKDHLDVERTRIGFLLVYLPFRLETQLNDYVQLSHCKC